MNIFFSAVREKAGRRERRLLCNCGPDTGGRGGIQNYNGAEKRKGAPPGWIAVLLVAAAILTGCVPEGSGVSQDQPNGNESLDAARNQLNGSDSVESAQALQGGSEGWAAGQASAGEAVSQSVRGLDFTFEADPHDFSVTLIAGEDRVEAAVPGRDRTVEQYQRNGNSVSWRYPEERISVSIESAGDYLSVALTSEGGDDNAFTWPQISADAYYFPFGEGKRVPAGERIWQEYLSGQEFFVPERLSMPFWAQTAGKYTVLYIMEEPFHTNMRFGEAPGLTFSIENEFPAIDPGRTKRFRIYLTDGDPVHAAKLYKNYVVEKGNFVTLEQKAEQNPNIRKLYGAPFLYLWGEQIVSQENINWPAFRSSLDNPVMEYLAAFAPHQENGAEFLTVLEEMGAQDYSSAYQKNVVCNYLSELLKRPDFYDPTRLPESDPVLEALKGEYERLNEADMIRANKEALAVNLPGVFQEPSAWMDEGTVGLLRQLQEAGIEQAWIGLNSWEQAYAKPELVKEAVDLGYLIGSYDSYHSIHEPGKEEWITARFEDPSLYEQAAVSDKDGRKISGFQGVGRKLNPVLSLPAVKNRMQTIMENELPFNSWFVDCDATGEIYDDYTPEHVTTQQEDLKARLERMAYIRDTYDLVIGSEGGNDFAASTVAFAHGLELQSFSWMDADMKENKDSEYYIGKYYNPSGGVAEHFANRIPIKNRWYTLFADPKYDIPLYKLVYNDSVITGYHWDWSTFKIQGLTQERMLREILYNVPPLYHLDTVEWEKYKQDIVRHNAVWSQFSRRAILREMTDFQILTDDGSVQMTEYGKELRVVANFLGTPFEYETYVIPGESVLIITDGESLIYTPQISVENA